MKSIKYVFISILIFFLLIMKYWTINRNLPRAYILVNSDKDFTDYHINFKREIRKDWDDPWISPIKYYINPSVLKDKVKLAIEILQNNTCVTFSEQNETFDNTRGLIFQKAHSGCESFVGHVHGIRPQTINLSLHCQKNEYLILHELGHALGLVHEHSRIGRDKFIDIDYSQLGEEGKINFRIRNGPNYLNYSVDYDYASVMHYGPYDFSSFWMKLFGFPVIKSKLYWQYTYMMGQEEKVTFNDYKRINLCYCNWCNWVNNRTGERIDKNSTKCRNSGYPDFRNCSKCICPTGYTGHNCGQIIESDDGCGNTTYNANKTNIPIILVGKINCYILVRASEKKKKVSLIVSYLNAPSYTNNFCTERNAFQIKYRRDKGATGLLLCGHQSIPITIKSESRSILIMYKGIDGHSMMHFLFKETD
uniref:Metalloendopeptidase n=2 Tax=Strongyloides stercoralis TaxID=6248 RepID=A0A0K0EGS1_STRER